jgi:D-aminoacyl-tRNA deacylase
MRALLQRVTQAHVTVDGHTVGSIGPGLLVFLGIGKNDSQKQADALLEATANLRIFEDSNHKMNLSLLDTSKTLLCVSQFTLYANLSKGRRPSFTDAMPPAEAQRLYEYFCAQARAKGLNVATGIFGADMKVSLTNDGPVTLWLEEN